MAAVGFVGLGAMGQPMARRLLRLRPLFVFDRCEIAQQALVGAGASPASLKELPARTSVIFLSLPASATVEVLEALRPGLGPRHVVIDCSTTGQENAVAAGKAVSATGAAFLDAPVSGLPARAEEGSLVCMVGGDVAMLEIQRPLLGAMASQVVHVGDVGHGQLAKTFNNCIYNVGVATMAEMLPLAARLGLSAEALAEVVRCGSGSSFGFTQWAPVVLERRFEPGLGYPMGEAHKDLINLEAAAAVAGVKVGPVLRGTAETYRAALEMGLGDTHKGAMVRVHEARLAVEVGRSQAHLRPLGAAEVKV